LMETSDTDPMQARRTGGLCYRFGSTFPPGA
jgi:hypothetical protein